MNRSGIAIYNAPLSLTYSDQKDFLRGLVRQYLLFSLFFGAISIPTVLLCRFSQFPGTTTRNMCKTLGLDVCLLRHASGKSA